MTDRLQLHAAPAVDYVIFASYGNDSVGLIQWAAERQLERVAVLYNDTGWGAPGWPERVSRLEGWARSLGFVAERTASVGMEALVHKERGWPRHGMQFCTEHLKIKPSLAWLNRVDPDGLVTCLVGVRREESAKRRSFPEFTEASPGHGGRSLWAPLVNTTTEQRNDLLRRAGVEPLPHRSDECWPCVNATKADLRRLTDERVAEIEEIESRLGFTGAGKPRVMFRPAAHMGAVGIREMRRWANSGHGEYEPPSGCDSGMCAA